jgi:hypothetical protein
MKLFETLGGRKFVFAVLLTIGLFVLAVLSKISYQELITALQWIYGIFVVGNIGSKVATNLDNK